MKRAIIVSASIIAFSSMYWVSCKHDPALGPFGQNNTVDTPPVVSTNCDPDTVYFQNVVLPVIQSSCAKSGCHDAATQAEGVYLGTYASIMNTGRITPGNPSKSKLYRSITENGEDKMPPAPNTPLTQSQIDLIYRWIQQGAKNNYCADLACDSVNVTFSANIWPVVETSCKGCHSGSNPGGGITLMNYNDVKNYSNRIWGSITYSGGYSAMPKNGNKLSVCSIAQFKRWRDLGMPNN